MKLVKTIFSFSLSLSFLSLQTTHAGEENIKQRNDNAVTSASSGYERLDAQQTK